MEDVLANLGVKLSHVVVGTIAGAVGVIFNKKPRTTMGKVKASVVVVAGAMLTGFITPLILLWQPWLVGAEHGVAFLTGIFGMGIIESLLSFLKVFKDKPIETIEKLKGNKDITD